MILAKSAQNGLQVDLAQHTRAVITAAEAMFGNGSDLTRLGKSWLRFFGLPAESAGRFLLNLRLAAALHDIGKANGAFQDALHGNGPQVVRHEHLSGLVLNLQPVRDSFGKNELADIGIVSAAVVSHHAKANCAEFCKRKVEGNRAITLSLSAPEVQECMAVSSETLGQSLLPACKNDLRLGIPGDTVNDY